LYVVKIPKIVIPWLLYFTTFMATSATSPLILILRSSTPHPHRVSGHRGKQRRQYRTFEDLNEKEPSKAPPSFAIASPLFEANKFLEPAEKRFYNEEIWRATCIAE
jgi:hypothetical protein